MRSARNETLDGLRGVAVLLVVAIHSAQTFKPALAHSATVANRYGAFGVQLFFIISGFTMMLTFGKTLSETSVCQFYVRRFLRIAPMFWLAGASYLLLFGVAPRYWAPEGLSLSDILLTASFLHWLSPSAFNSVVPGGWSIAVEMLFYAIFPVLLAAYRSTTPVLCYVLIIGVFVAGKFAERLVIPHFSADDYLIGSFFFFWLPNQIVCFGLGILLFELIEDKRRPLLVSALFAGIALTSDFAMAVFCLFLFCYGALSLSIPPGLLANIGRASYSIYLVHFAILEGLKGLPIPLEVGFPVTVLASWAAYSFVTGPLIEQPFMSLARRMNAGRKPDVVSGEQRAPF